MADIVCFGDLLIDFVPTESGLSMADVPAFKKAPGGAAANVAVGLARLGVKSAFIGKVGDEAFGHFLAQTLIDDGVDTSALRFDPKSRTALAFVTLEANGERDFLFYRHPSADMSFTPEQVDLSVIDKAKIFHFDSISFAAPQPRQTALFSADHARSQGKLISFDVNLRLPLWDSTEEAKRVIPEGLARADIVKLSDDELEFMTGSREPQAFRDQLWQDNIKLAIISLGRDGSIIFTPNGRIEVPSVPVKPVDTTGAGDAFVAGLLASVLEKPDLFGDDQAIYQAARFANAAGAMTTTGRGAIPALPSREQVLAMLGDAG